MQLSLGKHTRSREMNIWTSTIQDIWTLVNFLYREHGKVLLNMIYHCVVFDVSDWDIVTSVGTLASSLDSLSKQNSAMGTKQKILS